MTCELCFNLKSVKRGFPKTWVTGQVGSLQSRAVDASRLCELWGICVHCKVCFSLYNKNVCNVNVLFWAVNNIVLLFFFVFFSGGPLSALTCCVNVRLLSAIKKISPLIYSQSWVGSWVYTTQAMMTFTLIF